MVLGDWSASTCRIALPLSSRKQSPKMGGMVITWGKQEQQLTKV